MANMKTMALTHTRPSLLGRSLLGHHLLSRFILGSIITLLVASTLMLKPKLAQAAIEEVQFSHEIQLVRYKALIAELRCLVCQNQNLADSNAPLAVDLKRLVEDLIKQGQSDQEIYNFLTERYGDFVLYDPPLKATTYLLWFGPALFLFIGILIFISQVRKRQSLREKQ